MAGIASGSKPAFAPAGRGAGRWTRVRPFFPAGNAGKWRIPHGPATIPTKFCCTGSKVWNKR